MLRTNAPQQAGQQNADNLLAAFVSGHGLGINRIRHGMAPGQKKHSPSICYLCHRATGNVDCLEFLTDKSVSDDFVTKAKCLSESTSNAFISVLSPATILFLISMSGDIIAASR
ncbi:MAG: hypothetical protein CMJ19_12510 [Phycisphaeraceae bacterium]|nr:hypothetical protein [Phycisphaeraceae bacterium]|tara:strand:- start:71 stop:412 length:342 start_codon:yes stop_codon:yes gene_type:complete